MNLDGTDRSFVLENGSDWDRELQQRLQSFDIHISGLLPGLNDPKDKYASSGQAADIEEAVCKQFALLVEGCSISGCSPPDGLFDFVRSACNGSA